MEGEVDVQSNGKSGGSSSKIPLRVEKTKTGTLASGSTSTSTTISRSTTTTFISSSSSSTPSSSQSKKSPKKITWSDMPVAAVSELDVAVNEDQVEVPPVPANSSEEEEEVVTEPITGDNECAGSVTNLSFQTARTAGSRLSSAISSTSQKGITVLSNAYQQASSMLTGANRNNDDNGSTSNVEVLYPRSRANRPSTSSRQQGVSALEEGFRARSRASAMRTETYDSDDGDLEEELIEEEESRSAKIYKQSRRILRYLLFLAINLTCVPIYWLVVQAFVLEKWILNTSPPRPLTPRQQGRFWLKTIGILTTVLILAGLGFTAILWTNKEMMEIWTSKEIMEMWTWAWPWNWNNSEGNASLVENQNKT